ncbi:MAG: N-acetylglucosamine-6-phosphate deacetylase [Elusimicrobiaceae bacterium]|nr:N-acetylglucosamine-6-phosphate deacetylase [Elusimicrobiaceae bacterium]
MKHFFITNVRLITPQQVLADHGLEIEAGKIKAVFPMKEAPLPLQQPVVDAHGAFAAPGLIDTHVHGLAGFGTEQGTPQALLEMSNALAKTGVTAFCPTLYCAQPSTLEKFLEQMTPAFGRETGARLLGFHLEGPFISPEKPGVMKPQDILPVDAKVLERLYKASDGHIISMTVAPELAHIESLIPFCQKHHILLQAGHTNASYENFMHGVSLGITHTTHLFNAMPPLHHRALGAVGAVLLHPEISAEIIADGVHVHPDLVVGLRRFKPVENIVLVTDALRPTLQNNPPFIANAEEVKWQDGAWVRQADGVLAGSGLTMLEGVKNLISWGYTLPQAIACASTHPARILGLEQKGSLSVGKDADIILLDDALQLQRVFLAHRSVVE